jgi:hypothetical protein
VGKSLKKKIEQEIQEVAGEWGEIIVIAHL